MEIGIMTEMITTLGFPIACVVALAWFCFYMVQKTNETNKYNMEQLQQRCLTRETKLYEEIKENREVNAKAIETIARYAEKLDIIQTDVNEIKTDITILMNK